MKRVWKKLGKIYAPRSSCPHPKLLTHAANPLAVNLDGDIHRIFYSGRDEASRSSVGAVDINLKTKEIVADHSEPFFEYGPCGTFFADGVSIGNCYEVNGIRYMLFMGWQRLANGRWRGDIGRLVVTPDCNLELESDQPLMSCGLCDPISLSYPWVQPRSSGCYDMWYGSTLAWDAGNGEMLHVIHHAHSDNGHEWHRNGLSIPFQLGLAQAFSRPTVSHRQDGLYEMWFSYRSGGGDTYRIGYATSQDGFEWQLALGQAGISVSDSGWDSEMVEYPFVFDYDGKLYMLYNGNGFGRSGFGLAVLDDTF